MGAGSQDETNREWAAAAAGLILLFTSMLRRKCGKKPWVGRGRENFHRNKNNEFFLASLETLLAFFASFAVSKKRGHRFQASISFLLHV